MITLKIGRYTYKITKSDIFLDNNVCVQLITQSQEKPRLHFGGRPTPILSKIALKKISSFNRIVEKEKHGAVWFRLDLG